jgi:hypothetical protein
MAARQHTVGDPPGEPIRNPLVRLVDTLGRMEGGVDALMHLSVSEHLDETAQSALAFVHASLADLRDEASEIAEGLLEGSQREGKVIPLPAHANNPPRQKLSKRAANPSG